jgi:hypothetical protein
MGKGSLTIWRIDKDHLAEGDGGSPIPSRAGMMVPRDADPTTKLPHRFKIYDDDDELYYEGRSSRIDFEPLDWAMWDAGATRIDYLENGKWVTL